MNPSGDEIQAKLCILLSAKIFENSQHLTIRQCEKILFSNSLLIHFTIYIFSKISLKLKKKKTTTRSVFNVKPKDWYFEFDKVQLGCVRLNHPCDFNVTPD